MSLGTLVSVDDGARLRGARGKKLQYVFRGGVGSVASLAAPQHLLGKVVCVVGAELDMLWRHL